MAATESPGSVIGVFGAGGENCDPVALVIDIRVRGCASPRSKVSVVWPRRRVIVLSLIATLTTALLATMASMARVTRGCDE